MEGTRPCAPTIVDERSNDFSLWPFGLRVELLGQPVPSTFVCDRDFREVVFQYSLVEVDDELCTAI